MLRRRKRANRGAPAAGGDDADDHVGGGVDPEPGVAGELRGADGVGLWHRWAGEDPSDATLPTLVVPCCGNADDLGGLVVPGRRVLFYDVRNRGRSDTVADPRRLGFQAEVDDLAAVCDQLGLGRVSLFGWSYHAGVVTQLALADPRRVERLVLAAAIPIRSNVQPTMSREPAPHLLAWLDQLQAEKVPAHEPDRWCAEWRKVYVPLRMGDPSGFDRLHSPCAMPNEHPGHMAMAVANVLTDLGTYDWGADLRELAAPVLIVHGTADADPMESADLWVQALPDARLLPLEGVGQLPWAEAPGPFYATVNAFLDGRPV